MKFCQSSTDDIFFFRKEERWESQILGFSLIPGNCTFSNIPYFEFSQKAFTEIDNKLKSLSHGLFVHVNGSKNKMTIIPTRSYWYFIKIKITHNVSIKCENSMIWLDKCIRNNLQKLSLYRFVLAVFGSKKKFEDTRRQSITTFCGFSFSDFSLRRRFISVCQLLYIQLHFMVANHFQLKLIHDRLRPITFIYFDL